MLEVGMSPYLEKLSLKNGLWNKHVQTDLKKQIGHL